MFFGILDLQNIAKTYILQCKIAFFDFQEAPKKKHVVLEVFLGAAKKVCDPACGLLGGRGRVGSGRSW
jgi:hypothetical protein